MQVESWFYKVASCSRLLLGRRELDQQLDDEIVYHLQAKAKQNIAKGMTTEDANRAVCGAVASFLPAHRVSNTDPMAAMRYE